ncbi:MAG: NUDIX domain-containing protein [Flavobacteriales bacterium]|nr:NUDIX domain-containing protein [Flavobacteriales bacterium]
MARKYEVSIEGRPVVILDKELSEPPRKRWTTHSLPEPEQLEDLLDIVARTQEGDGSWFAVNDPEALWDSLEASHHPVVAAGGVVSDERDRILMIFRNGKWDLPKGKIEREESLDEAAIREVKEECGLTQVELLGPLMSTWHTYPWKGRKVLKRTDWFSMRSSSFQVLKAQVEEGIEQVRWMDEAQRRSILPGLWPSLVPVISAWEGELDRSRT